MAMKNCHKIGLNPLRDFHFSQNGPKSKLTTPGSFLTVKLGHLGIDSDFRNRDCF